MSVLVLPQDLQFITISSDILSESITYIPDMLKRQIQLGTHLAKTFHAVPPGGTHRSNYNIRTTIRQQDDQQPKRQHQALIDHLGDDLGHLARRGQTLATCDPDDIANCLTSVSRVYLSQPRPTSQQGLVAQPTLYEIHRHHLLHRAALLTVSNHIY